jgi:hypothetical protein
MSWLQSTHFSAYVEYLLPRSRSINKEQLRSVMVGGKDTSGAHGALAARSFLLFRACLEQFSRKTLGAGLDSLIYL